MGRGGVELIPLSLSVYRANSIGVNQSGLRGEVWRGYCLPETLDLLRCSKELFHHLSFTQLWTHDWAKPWQAGASYFACTASQAL